MIKVYAKIKMANIIEFLNNFGSLACNYQSSNGLPAIAVLAQMALETGWGRHIINVQQADGKNIASNNLFNIKATPDWKGNSGRKIVDEYYGGYYVLSNEIFRAYNTFDDSMQDYLFIISTLPRYAYAWENKLDPFKYIAGVANGGWATSPYYLNVIISIMTNSIGISD
jgi:flagellar protein FlgJ